MILASVLEDAQKLLDARMARLNAHYAGDGQGEPRPSTEVVQPRTDGGDPAGPGDRPPTAAERLRRELLGEAS